MKPPAVLQTPPRRGRWIVLGIAVAAAALAGCSGASTAAPAMPITSQAAAINSSANGAITTSAPAPSSTKTAASVASDLVPSTESAPLAVLMPNVACLTLKDARKKLSALGSTVSTSDVTGKGRSQIVDGNWVVVTQTPPAGSQLTEAGSTLAVAKKGEAGYCGTPTAPAAVPAQPRTSLSSTAPKPTSVNASPTTRKQTPPTTSAKPRPVTPATVSRPTSAAPAPATTSEVAEPTTVAEPPEDQVSYKNCAEAKAAGVAPILEGQPGYRPGLDRDGDGIACDK